MEISASQYLDMALKEQKGLSETIQNKNRIKSLIREYFSNKTECFTLVKPFQDGSSNLLRDEFKS